MAPVPVVSYAIDAVAYDPGARVLEVQFTGKPALYRYQGVPPELFEEFKRSWAFGQFINERVKPFYRFEKLTLREAARRPLHETETRRWRRPLESTFTRARKKLERRGYSRREARRILGVDS